MNAPILGAAVQCELCGNETTRTRRALVDKTVLQVCPNCEKFGRVLDAAAAKAPLAMPGNVPMALEKRKRQQPKDVYSAQGMSLEMVEDFAHRIKTAREAKGWTRQDLGGRIGEREVVVARFENGSLHPPDDVAKKIERELGIKLFEAVATGGTKPQATTRSMTLGDMLRDAQRKKEQ